MNTTSPANIRGGIRAMVMRMGPSWAPPIGPYGANFRRVGALTGSPGVDPRAHPRAGPLAISANRAPPIGPYGAPFRRVGALTGSPGVDPRAHPRAGPLAISANRSLQWPLVMGVHRVDAAQIADALDDFGDALQGEHGEAERHGQLHIPARQPAGVVRHLIRYERFVEERP